ncbi:MAG: hypothetical protein U0325_30060 [Polyangiales bacterium]
MRSPLVIAALLALTACRRTTVTPDVSEALDPESTLAPGEQDAGAPPTCRVLVRRVVQRGGAPVDAGEVAAPAHEALRVAQTARRRTLLWVDGRAGQLVLAPEGEPQVTRALGPGERSDPALSLVGARDEAAVTWVQDRLAGRRHLVRVGDRGCQHPETRDEGLSVSTARVGQGLLVAWDDDGPPPAAGAVKVQWIDPATLRAQASDDALPTCAAPWQASPAVQDASDPVLAPTPEGGAVLVWLTARDINATQANDTVTDLWAQAVGPTGRAVGIPLRLTNAPGHRFGVSVSVGEAGSAWVAWRESEETDSESRGDGGDVVALRVERGPEGLRRASDPRVVSGPGIVPTGAPAVFARGTVALVFLRHRQGVTVRTYARALRTADGAVAPGDLRFEPLLRGELPAAMDPQGGLHLPVSSPDGSLELVRLRCEAR